MSSSRQAAVTINVLNEYKQMIAEATSDLQDHLQEMEERVKTLQLPDGPVQNTDILELREIKEEKESTEQFLVICAQVSNYIEGIPPRLPRDSHADGRILLEHETAAGSDPHRAQKMTGTILADFKSRLATNSAELKARLKEPNDRLKALSQQGVEISNEGAAELKYIKEEKDRVAQCLAICADTCNLAESARTNEFEDIVSADNSHQLVV